jgi:hypothetical protein
MESWIRDWMKYHEKLPLLEAAGITNQEAIGMEIDDDV